MSIAGAPVSGGASLAISPAATAGASGLFVHATGVLGMSISNMMSGDSYNSGNSNIDEWGGTSKQSDAEYHYKKHGDEIGAKSFNDYTRKATAFKDTILKKGISPKKKVNGKTTNVYRYNHNGKYIDLEHIMGTDLLGQPKILDYKIISYGTIK